MTTAAKPDTREATLPKCRTALTKKYGTDTKGEANVQMYRSPSGYYYFSGDTGITVSSIYSFNIRDWSVQEVLDHVASSIARGF